MADAVAQDAATSQVKNKLNAKEKLEKEIVAKLDESKELQAKSEQLAKQADEASDPEEAERLRVEAKNSEDEAKTRIRQARRLEKGYFQGGATGAGIGAGLAGGLGTVVGALVGGVVAIPTAGLGVLVGAGVGAVHGPWVKLVQDTVKQEDEKEEGLAKVDPQVME
jgi:RNA polymerase-binding transcription factor DksA